MPVYTGETGRLQLTRKYVEKAIQQGTQSLACCTVRSNKVNAQGIAPVQVVLQIC